MSNLRQNTQNPPNPGTGVLRGALGMGMGTLLSRILGYLRDIILFRYFSKEVTDCFIVAFRIPNYFRRVLGEGALAVSFIPTYLELLAKEPEKARELRNVLFSFLFVVTGILSVLGILFMDDLIHMLVANGEFGKNPEKIKLAVRLGKWLFAYLFLVTQFAFAMSVLNAHKKFWIPGLAPSFYNFGFIVFALLGESYFSFSGQQLAFGVLFGGVLQAGLVIWKLVQVVGFPSFNFRFSNKVFLRVLTATVPSILGIGVLQIISIINVKLCAEFQEGAHTLLYAADRLLELPQSLIAVSIGTAMLPNLSELWVSDRIKFSKSLDQSLSIFLFLGLPSAVGLYFLAAPLTQLLFQGVKFSYSDVVATTPLVQVYSVALIVSGLNRILVPVFFSIKNTWYPAVGACLVVVFHYFVSFGLLEFLHVMQNYLGCDPAGCTELLPKELQLSQLSVVTSATLLSGTFYFLFLSFGLFYFLKRFFLKGLFNSFIRFILPNVIMATFLFFAVDVLPTEKNFFLFFGVGAIVGISVLLYFGACFLLRVEEVNRFKRLIPGFKTSE